MPGSSQLYELIQSMTPSEKGYFKKYAYKKGGKTRLYLQLFDAIEKQKKYDSKALARNLNGSHSEKNFAGVKSYLFKLVVATLIDYHNDKQVYDRVLNALREIELLKERGLFSSARRKLEFVKQMAADYELYEYESILLKLELEFVAYTSKEFQHQIDVLNLEKAFLQERIRVQDLRCLQAEYLALAIDHGFVSKTPEVSAKFDLLLNHPALAKKPDGLGFQGLFVYHFCLSGIHQALGHSLTAIHHSRQMIDLFDKNPKLKAFRYKYYLQSVNNLLNQQLGSGSLEGFDELAAAASELIKSLPQNETVGERKTYLNGRILHKYLYEKRLDQALDFLPEVESNLSAFRLQPANNRMLRYLIAVVRFYNGELTAALDIVNDLLNETDMADSYENRFWTLLLNLLIHYELGNRTLLIHARNSAYRYLKNLETNNKIETVLLRYLGKLARSPLEEEFEIFKQLYTEMLELSKRPDEQFELHTLDLIWWLEQRLGLAEPFSSMAAK